MSDARIAYDSRLAHAALAALRIVAALILLQHAGQQLFGLLGGHLNSGQPSPTLSRAWWAGVLSIVGAPLVALGLFTRPAAFALSGLMAIAYFWVHVERGFFPVVNRGEPAVLLCFVFFFLFAAGPGEYSLDARRGKERSANHESRIADRSTAP
ncbi:MAG TPA: DoxX family protein [Gemmatimonadaceae bacterium]|nr:DoxX family protein [Gemmatimonadaceae bacterium]